MRGLALMLALLVGLPEGTQAAAPPLAESRCAAAALVDAAFRDAALQALHGLVVSAPGQPADGALRTHHSAGHRDAQGQAWHQVSAYPVNLGLVGALNVSPAVLPVAEGWLKWQARHIPTTGPQRGVVMDHWVRAGSFEESSCPPGIEARLCLHVDAFDSTAASTLLMADAYLRHGGRVALLREPAMRAALEAAAMALRDLGTAEGLTLALPGHRVAYTMDAVEVIAGWRAWARLQERAYAEPAAAELSLAQAQRAHAAMDTRLWDAARGSWRVSAGGPAPDRRRWYPDTVAQAWPLLWSAEPGTRLRDAGAWQQAVAAWQRPAVHWADHRADPAGFAWPAAAVASLCIGEPGAARRWVARARERWMNPQDPFAWPFQVGDLLWLFWLAEPVPRPAGPAAAPADTHPPSA